MNAVRPRLPFPPLLLATALLACSTVATHTADWPQWRGPGRDGFTGLHDPLPDALPAEPRLLWAAPAGEGFASPVVAGDLVFLFDNQDGHEVLRALVRRDGTERWRTTIDTAFGDNQGPPGPRCTPVVDGDRVYAQSCQGAFACLDIRTGRVHWRFHFGTDYGADFIGERGNAPGATRHGNTGAPLIREDHIYVAVGSTRNAGMVCLDKRTGREVWRASNEIAAYAAPVLADIAGHLQVVNFMAEALIAFDARTGDPLWRVPVRTAFARHVTTPVVLDNLVIAASHQYGLFAVRLTPSDGGIHAAEAWKSMEGAMNFSSPIRVDTALYGLGPDRNVVCIDLPTGRLNWSQKGWVGSSPDKAHAGFLTDGSRALMLNDDGELFLWQVSPEACIELGRAQVCARNWCNPAYSNGRLYVRDGLRGRGELRCIELRPGS